MSELHDDILIPKELLFSDQYRYISDNAKIIFSVILTKFLNEHRNEYKYHCDNEHKVSVSISKKHLAQFTNLDAFHFKKRLSELIHNDLLVIDDQKGDLLKTRITLLAVNT